MLPTSVVRNDDIISPIIDDKAYMFSWKGNEKRILAYPVDYDKLLNITCTYPSKLSKQQISDDKSAAAVGMGFLSSLTCHEPPKLTRFYLQRIISRFLSMRS